MYDNNGNKYPIVEIHEFGDEKRPLIRLEPKDFKEFIPNGEFDWSGPVSIIYRANTGFRVICSMGGYPFIDCDIRGYIHLLKFMVLIVKKIKINVDVYPYKREATSDNLLFTGRYENGHCILKQIHHNKKEESTNDKITIDIDPSACIDLLAICELIIDNTKNYIEYLSTHCNPMPEDYPEKIDKETKRLNIMLKTKTNIEKAYDNYLGLNGNKETIDDA